MISDVKKPMTLDDSKLEELHDSALEEPQEKSLISRRKFLYTGILSASALAVAGCVSGIITRKNVQITFKTIELPNLPAAFKGLTITLASDIHSSPYMSLRDMQDIARLINELKSDVILLPGDFVTTHKNE